MAKLVIKKGRNIGTEFKLLGARLVMGRRSSSPIPIADAKASREHAEVILKDEEWYLHDLSLNGTFLNGQLASKTEPGSILKFGDTIKIGDTILELVDEKAEPVGIEIPGYTIHEKVGSGGMGIVYKAKQLSMDRIVALKVLNERYSANSEFVDRFIREARAAGRMNHPNVIHVHDISKANGRHYFSMEFVDGCSVKDLLRVERKLPFKRALDIASQCAKALEFAHENQIVHRDVKPDNIMITKEGIVKIADLGIAKTFEEAEPAPNEHRRVMGTPHYMAPEQALGKPIDHRVDIYSLGATLYHMLTGTTPFNGNTAHAILKAHIQESLPSVQDFNPDVPDSVCFIVERMMAKLPEKRYASMSKLLEDLERVRTNTATGIERLNVGDSTIMRAADGGRKKQKDSATGQVEEVQTGAQQLVAKQGLILLLVASGVLAAAVIAVVVYLRSGSKIVDSTFVENPATTEVPEVLPPQVTTPSVNSIPHSNPSTHTEPRVNLEAQKLLAAAKSAGKDQDWVGYEKLLRELTTKFSAAQESEEATKLLNVFLEKYNERVKEDARKAAEAKLLEAQNFEAEHADKLEEIVAQFEKVKAASQSVPAVLDVAKGKADEYRRRITARDTKKTDDSLKVALTEASVHKGKGDFDAARVSLQTFITRYPEAPQKKQAEAVLEKMNAEAAAKFAEVRTAAEKAELAPALILWTGYLDKHKDATTREDAGAQQKALTEKAQAIADEELKKAAEKARKYDYDEAILGAVRVQKKLPGTPWEETAKKRADDFKRQKDLHEKVMASVAEALKTGPVLLNFPIENRFNVDTWKLNSVQGDRLSLEPVTVNAAPGISKRIHELTAKEQGQFYSQFLKAATPEDQKSLEVFMKEREPAPAATAPAVP